MKKKLFLLVSIMAITALAACDVKPKPTPSSSIEPDSSSELPDTSSSSSSSSSSSQEDIGPVPTEIIIPEVSFNQDYAEEKAYSNDLLLNCGSVSVVADNGSNSEYSTKQLRGLARALQPANDLSFRSLDSSIASVDANGNVKGLKAGNTSIEVTDKAHPDVKKLVPVEVFNGLVPATNGEYYTQEEIDAAQPGDPAYGKTTDDYKVEPVDNEQDQIDAIANVVGAIDDNNLNDIVDHELREMSTYKNGKRQSYSIWDENLVCSKDEAYFRIYETDGDTKTEDGAMTFVDYEWIFNTNQYYDTYVFHTKGDVKNYYPVSTVDYMPADPNVNNRITPLYEILDNLFTIGRDIFTNTLENARISYKGDDGKTTTIADLITKPYSNVIKNSAGYILDENGNRSTKDFFFDVTLLFDDEEADQDDETNYGIPFGTKMPATQRMIYTIRDGKITHFRIELIQDYSFGGDNYQKVYFIDHVYERITDENKSKYMFVPDKAEYTLVDYLFAI